MPFQRAALMRNVFKTKGKVSGFRILSSYNPLHDNDIFMPPYRIAKWVVTLKTAHCDITVIPSHFELIVKCKVTF